MVGKWLDKVMGEPFKIIEDSAVMQEVITIIKEAREEIVLVSPYNDYHINLQNPLKAKATEVTVIAICREDQKGKEGAHLKWLGELPADVYLVERLHAKIYCNETTAMITSMNLSESSANNSREIGVKIKDPAKITEIRRYVDEGLIRHGKQIAARPEPPATHEAEPEPDLVRGFCIRCREGIPYNQEEPLCTKDKRTWNKYKNRDFPENHCHLCGHERTNISFAKPLCRSCYRKASAT